MTTHARSSASIGTEALTWPLAGERMPGEAAAMTLLSAGVEGILGHASPEVLERIQSVLRSMSGLVQDADIENALTGGGPSDAWGSLPHFVPYPSCTAADSIRLAIDALWSDADEAVFLFRRGDTFGAGSSLGRALLGLQDSFSPARVKRVKSQDGIWVIKDVFEYTAQGPSELGKREEKDKTGGAEQISLSELGEAAVLASHLLLSYFVQRVLELASEASQTRQTIESAYLCEGIS